MIDQTQAHRLAAAVNALRPDWPAASLSTFIRKNLAERAYRDAAVALAWVATDPETQTPARVLENGPWWRATMAEQGTLSAITHRCPEHPAHAAWSCPECATVAVPPAEGWATSVKASLSHGPKPAPRREPKPRDLSEVRERADREATS